MPAGDGTIRAWLDLAERSQRSVSASKSASPAVRISTVPSMARESTFPVTTTPCRDYAFLVMTRVLRYAALLTAAAGLSGCVFVPALVPSDDSSTSPAKTAATRSSDVSTARVALSAANQRLTVIN